MVHSLTSWAIAPIYFQLDSYAVLEDSAGEAVQLSSVFVGQPAADQENFRIRKEFPESWIWEQFNLTSGSVEDKRSN